MSESVAEQERQVSQALQKRYASALHVGESFEVTVTQTSEAIGVLFRLYGGLKGQEVSVEGRVPWPTPWPTLWGDNQPADRQETLYILYDALDTLLGLVFQANRTNPYSSLWIEGEFEGRKINYRVEVSYPQLDTMADALISQNPSER